jgi:hypothetical protein
MFGVFNLSFSVRSQCPSVIVTATLLNKQDRGKCHIELGKTADCGHIPTPLSVYPWDSLIDIVKAILVRNRLLYSLKGAVGSDEHNRKVGMRIAFLDPITSTAMLCL